MTGELPGSTRVGRVGIRVADLDRAVDFYTDVVGLAVVDQSIDRVDLGVDDERLLTLIAAPDAPERGPREAGLFHVAVRVPSQAALGEVLGRFESAWRLTGASDHLVSEALYARDPEGNGIEVYRDRPRAEWPDGPDGRVAMDTLPLDRDRVRSAIDGKGPDRTALPAGSVVGHVHLEAVDLDATRAFYTDVVGLRVRQELGSDAAFLAAGEYHHHLGLNVWNRRREPAGDGLGLAWYELVVPETALGPLRERVERSPAPVSKVNEGETEASGVSEAVSGVSESDVAFETVDPSGIRVRFRSE